MIQCVMISLVDSLLVCVSEWVRTSVEGCVNIFPQTVEV